jgi:hypothetical protein
MSGLRCRPQSYSESRASDRGHDGGFWPEPEATLAAGGVRGSTCRRSVGPNPPLVSRSRPSLIRLDPSELDNPGPLLGVFDDEFAEVSGRASKRSAAQVGETSLDLGIGESGVDLPVQLTNHLRGCVFGRARPELEACRVARHEFAHGRNLRQKVRARCSRDRERAQPASPDVVHGGTYGVEHHLHLPAKQIG